MKKRLLSFLLALVLLLPLFPAGGAGAAAGETIPAFYGTSLSLENSIAINFVVDGEAFAAAGFTDPEVTFACGAERFTETAYTEKDGYYYFTYRRLTASRMGDEVTAALSGVKNGERVAGESARESVLSYCRKALSQPDDFDGALHTLIVDLLTYGAKSQLYFDHKTDELVTNGLTAAQKEMGTQTSPAPESCLNTAWETTGGAEVFWKGADLNLGDRVEMRFYFDAKSTAGLFFVLKDETGREIAVFPGKDAERSRGLWRIRCDALTADRMADKLFLTAYRSPEELPLGEKELPLAAFGQAAVSDTLRYSVESYAANALSREDNPALREVLYAMLRYGASAKAYREKLAYAKRVADPMATPLYTFDHTPTVYEMRRMAVQAMRDELSVQWYSPVDISFSKGGSAAGDYVYDAMRVYGGLPYTSAGIGLFQFLNYYNRRTGRLLYTDGDTFNETIGNTCASSAAWALFTVCTSMRGLCISRYLTKVNGYFPLGEIDYDESIADFEEKSTTAILKEAGSATVYEAYAQVQSADLLVFSKGGDEGGHTMMAITEAVVERDSRGNIDPGASYIKIEDQRPDLQELTASDGSGVSFFGRRSTRFFFSYLYKNGYLPVTTAEFSGKKDYEAPGVYARFGDAAPEAPVSTRNISSVHLHSNYPMALVQFVAEAGSDGERVLCTKVFTRAQINSGSAFHWQMTDFANPLRQALKDAGFPRDGSAVVTARVTTSCGAVFEPVRFVYDFG